MRPPAYFDFVGLATAPLEIPKAHWDPNHHLIHDDEAWAVSGPTFQGQRRRLTVFALGSQNPSEEDGFGAQPTSPRRRSALIASKIRRATNTYGILSPAAASLAQP